MSAFYDLASLVFLPSGYKSGKLYAQKPLTTDGQLAFTRASTATRVNASGLIEAVASGVPRLDYLGSTCPKLILEGQRTNVFTYSNTFSNAAWGLGNVTLTGGQVGVNTSNDAFLMTENSANDVHRIQQTPVISGVSTISVYAKANTRNFLYLRGVQSSVNARAWFNLSTGTVGTLEGGATAKMTASANGYYRCEMTLNHDLGFELYIGMSSTNGGLSYQGNGTGSIFVQNAQAEVGAYATSYIPTLGASVTRVVDAASKTSISSLIGSTAGTVFFEGVYSSVNTTNTRFVSLKGAGTTYQNLMILQDNQNGTLNVQFVDASVTATVNITWTHGLTNGQSFKIAIAYASNDVVVYQNGLSKGTDTSYTPITFTDLYLQYTDTLGKTETKQTLLFKTRLTNAALAELTA
jgi:hypothetical protein